jgi:hypothetical protein
MDWGMETLDFTRMVNDIIRCDCRSMETTNDSECTEISNML